ncbi:ABC transporter permease [Thiohalocapsa marina]|uniref:ABC transporter permease n=1 Tax=Thiohalocapsa marina TaxID=424902 RepID=A0A5M8FLR6_9GAMM|nr:ABC transporter permease [Thiohalocapsa marina]KAA6185677.1 ABC transporter permease [Thiohalocapsa marina]
MWSRILAVFTARNREFYRDSAGLTWNILMPVMMILAFAFIFGGAPRDLLKVAVVGQATSLSQQALLDTPHITIVPVEATDAALAAAVGKVQRHQLDLLLDPANGGTYWVNPDSPTGVLAERLLLGAEAMARTARQQTPDQAPNMGPERRVASGEALTYADWVLPGVLAMNVMFSSLWGVGWVVVRYRKNGVLRRLKATPLRPFEFLTAQVLSRLLVVLGASTFVYFAATLILDFPMRGSLVALLLVYTAGALCMISLGLTVAARLRTEELADGLLNLLSWPMLLLSGVWFSMEGTTAAARLLSELMPLTHLVNAARAIMLDGAGVIDVLPQIGLLLALAGVLLTVAARLFRWE